MKTHTIKRLFALMLAGLMLLTAFACGKSTEESTSAVTTTATTVDIAQGTTAPSEGTETTVTTTEATTQYLDDLPEDLRYDGKTVTFLYREEIKSEFWAENYTGEVANDAIYKSISAVEERFGVNIEALFLKGHTTDVRTSYMDHIDNQILGGDCTYDWVDLMIGNAPVRMIQGNYINLLNLENLDLSKPWYIPNMEETVAVLDRLFFVSGDSSLGYLKCAFCIYYNKDLGEKYGVENLNEVVKSGKWTIEKVRQLATQTSTDLNGDGVLAIEDQLGFVNHDNNHRCGFVGSTNMQFFTPQEDGSHKFTFGTGRDHSVCTAISDLYYSTPGALLPNSSNASQSLLPLYNQISDYFRSDRIFMITAEMGDVVDCDFHSMSSTYSVLPYPKYDEEQENYYTTSRNTHNAFLMPNTCKDPEMAAAVLDALSAVKYQNALPAFYEVVLKTKYSADSETAETLQVCQGNIKEQYSMPIMLDREKNMAILPNAITVIKLTREIR